MEFNIPLTYHLYLNDFTEVITYNYDNKIIMIKNFWLFINKNNKIYKVVSFIPLENLLDFLVLYDNDGIRKIYYFLIIKYLSLKAVAIKNKGFLRNFFNYYDYYYDKAILLRQYSIINNDCVVITTALKFNICLIINNKTTGKTLIAIIDNNCDIDCLLEIIPNLYNNSRFEDIIITIIGGSIDNINIIIGIFQILKILKLSKMIKRTFIVNSKPLKSLKYNSFNDKISFVPVLNLIDDNNYDNYYSSLHKII